MKYEHILNALHQLENKSDEKRYQTDKETAHRYGIFYEWILNAHALKLGRPLRMLEIGVSHWSPNSMDIFCASTTTDAYVAVDWLEYRFPNEIPQNATIIQDEAYNEKIVEYLRTHEEPFDILIDDGSHKLEHQLFFLEHYSQLAAEHGLLIIEDFANLDNNLLTIQTQYPDIFVIDNRLNGYEHDSVLLIHGIPARKTTAQYQQAQIKLKQKELAQKYIISENDPEFEYIVWQRTKGKYYSDIFGKFAHEQEEKNNPETS